MSKIQFSELAITLTHILVQTPTVRTFTFTFPPDQDISFKAGQFVLVHTTDAETGRKKKKPYSIASSPSEQRAIQICVKLVEGGFMSHFFFHLQEGDAISVSGPYGVFQLKKPIARDIVFAGTGTGIAPLRSMLYELLEESFARKIYIILGVRYETEILFQDEFEHLTKKHKNIIFIPTVSRPTEKWQGERGYVQEVIKKHTKAPQDVEIYACGLVQMIEDLKITLTASGFSAGQIHYEKWA